MSQQNRVHMYSQDFRSKSDSRARMQCIDSFCREGCIRPPPIAHTPLPLHSLEERWSLPQLNDQSFDLCRYDCWSIVSVTRQAIDSPRIHVLPVNMDNASVHLILNVQIRRTLRSRSARRICYHAMLYGCLLYHPESRAPKSSWPSNLSSHKTHDTTTHAS